jgi:hypothetical protein
LIVTPKGIFLVGRQIEKSGPNKGQEIETLTRRIEFSSLYQVSSHMTSQIQAGPSFFTLFINDFDLMGNIFAGMYS